METKTLLVRAGRATVILGIAGGALYSSVHVVNPNEAGVIRAFGAVTSVAPPGMHMTLPWPFGELVRVNTSSVDRISVGFRLLEHGLGLRPPEDMVQWLTGDTNIVEIQALVAYTIADPTKFLYAISDRGEENWMALQFAEPQRLVVRRAAEAVLTRRIANMSVDEVLTFGKAELQVAAVGEIQALLDVMQSGISVSALLIQSATPPQLVIEAFNDVQSARSYRDQRIAEADGYVRDEEPKARGSANAVREEAETYRTERLAAARGVLAKFESLCVEAQKARPMVLTRLWIDSLRAVFAKSPQLKVVPADEPQRIIIEVEDP